MKWQVHPSWITRSGTFWGTSFCNLKVYPVVYRSCSLFKDIFPCLPLCCPMETDNCYSSVRSVLPENHGGTSHLYILFCCRLSWLELNNTAPSVSWDLGTRMMRGLPSAACTLSYFSHRKRSLFWARKQSPRYHLQVHEINAARYLQPSFHCIQDSFSSPHSLLFCSRRSSSNYRLLEIRIVESQDIDIKWGRKQGHISNCRNWFIVQSGSIPMPMPPSS